MKNLFSGMIICLALFISPAGCDHAFAQLAGDIDFDMVLVEGGSFLMGNEQGADLEKPVHKVILSDFYIGKFEVTQKQWTQVMGNNPSEDFICDDCPVIYVSYYDVKKFIEKVNSLSDKHYRLPTEAEWEYASRGGKLSKGYLYSGSNNPRDVAWYAANSNSELHPVGQKKPNELGIYDMSGNVWEWANDLISYTYYEESPAENPKGPDSGNCNAIRGGCFIDSPVRLSVTLRGHEFPDKRFSILGFRLATDYKKKK